MKRKNKYNNKKVETEEGVYDSKKEYRRSQQLKLLQDGRVIHSLEEQKTFVLIQGVMYEGKKIRDITYVADFYYFDSEKEKWVIEDVKSKITRENAVYKIKVKMLKINILQHNNDIIFIET